jgi:hypothetical protein
VLQVEEEFFDDRNLNYKFQNKKKTFEMKMMNITQPDENAKD